MSGISLILTLLFGCTSTSPAPPLPKNEISTGIIGRAWVTDQHNNWLPGNFQILVKELNSGTQTWSAILKDNGGFYWVGNGGPGRYQVAHVHQKRMDREYLGTYGNYSQYRETTYTGGYPINGPILTVQSGRTVDMGTLNIKINPLTNTFTYEFTFDDGGQTALRAVDPESPWLRRISGPTVSPGNQGTVSRGSTDLVGASKPDIIVNAIRAFEYGGAPTDQPIAGQMATIQMDLRNAGNAASGSSFTTKYYVNGVLITRETHGDLVQGATHTTGITPDNPFPTPGTYQVQGEVIGVINEMNTSNNSKEVTVTVAPPGNTR